MLPMTVIRLWLTTERLLQQLCAVDAPVFQDLAAWKPPRQFAERPLTLLPSRCLAPLVQLWQTQQSLTNACLPRLAMRSYVT